MKEVKLTRKNGILKVNIDGEIIEPLSFKSFRPTARNISDFAKAGVKLFSILSSGMINMLKVPYSLYGESWIGDHQYDFAVIDRQIELFRENAPDCYFALMVQLDTRPWWLEAHPGVPYSFTHLSQTIAHEEWRKDAADYLKAVITHVEEKYGDIFYGYFMLCGFTTEWFSQFDEEESHPIKEAAYRAYLGDPAATIPTREEVDGLSDHNFMPEETMTKVKQYRRFHAELIADSLLYFAKEAQSVLKHKKLLGVYFGYLFELYQDRLWNAGHLAYEKVFTSPDIDMISSPSAYGYRREDSTSAFMITYDTLDRHNKLYYLEFDHITHLAPPDVDGIMIPGGDSKYKDHTQTLNVMQRDFMLCAAKGAALWWFDMFEGWFYSDEMMGAIQNMIQLSKELTTLPNYQISEILVIASGEALYGANKHSGLNNLFLGDQRNGLARMGAPYDVYSVCDINDLNLDQYKLIIFLDAFEMNTKDYSFIQKIKNNGKTILWLYAPGYITNGLESIRQLTEMQIAELDSEESKVLTPYGTHQYPKLKKPLFHVEDPETEPLGTYENSGKTAIAVKHLKNWTSIYSAVGNLNGEILREIAKKAGVHIYCEDAAAPVYISSLIKCVYSLKDTVLYVEDGEYEELFSHKTYNAVNGILEVPAGELASKMFIKK